ncbi:MAG TPA: thioredoxin domain-containing protein [Pyrinomonadaceae bacterium]|nr:thioredoxin domain-containing protein [Pyrinomonadaceae bacterium]
MRKEVGILLAIVVVVIIAGMIGASYYRGSVQSVPANKPQIAENLVRPDSASLGPSDAKVTVVEFLDPECESCAAFAPQAKSLLKEFDGKVRFVVRYMPLHKNAKLAAAYTEAAGEQGKYWEMQEKLFAKQGEWGEKHGPAGHDAAPTAPVSVLFERYATELGLNVQQLNAAAGSGKYLEKAERDLKDGQALGVRQTPTFFVNGRKLARLTQQDLRTLINEELNK